MIRHLKRLLCRVFGHRPSVTWHGPNEIVPCGRCMRCGHKFEDSQRRTEPDMPTNSYWGMP